MDEWTLDLMSLRLTFSSEVAWVPYWSDADRIYRIGWLWFEFEAWRP